VDDDAKARMYLDRKLEHYIADHVAYWDIASGNFTKIYSVADFVSPDRESLEEEMSMTWATGLSCVTDDDGDDTATVDALDWSHASSVTTFLSTNLNEVEIEQ